MSSLVVIMIAIDSVMLNFVGASVLKSTKVVVDGSLMAPHTYDAFAGVLGIGGSFHFHRRLRPRANGLGTMDGTASRWAGVLPAARCRPVAKEKMCG